MDGGRESSADPMGTLDDVVAEALAVSSRRRLLQELMDAEAPRTAADLAEAVGLHVNTVRTHLELLVKARLIKRHTEPAHGPGRPRTLYSPAPDAPTAQRSRGAREMVGRGYEDLARLFVEELSRETDAGQRAVTAGRRWPLEGLDRSDSVDQARARLVALLDRLGFSPSTEPVGDRIYLHRCPFLELARSNQTVVCGVHRGLLDAAADQLGTLLTVSAVRPFVRDNVCLVELATSN